MAADEVDEKSFEKTDDTSSKTYKPESDDLKASYTARVEELGTELKQRVADYMEDKARETSSWGMLKDLRLSIVDSGVSILRKPGKSGGATATKTSGEDKSDGGTVDKTEQSATKLNDAVNPAAVGGDWVDNMLDESMNAIGLERSEIMPPTGMLEPEQIAEMQKLADQLPTGLIEPEQIAKMIDLAPQMPTGLLEPEQIAKMIELGTELPTGLLEPEQIAKMTQLATELPTGMLDAEQIAKLTELATELPTGMLDPQQIAKLTELAPELPTGLLDPTQAAVLNAGDKGASTTPTESTETERPNRARASSVEEGALGDRSKDSGMATLEKPDVHTTKIGDKELPDEYRMPDGQTYSINYDADGKPSRVTIPDQMGKPVTFTKDGDLWKGPDGQWDANQLRDVKVDDKGRVLFVRDAADSSQKAVRISPDGTLDNLKNYQEGTSDMRESTIDANGRVTQYRGDGVAVTEPGSHITEIRDGDQVKGYEIKDDQGHVKRITPEGDGVTIESGDRTEKLVGTPEFKDGKLTLKNKDGSSVEVNSDGTEIRKDKKNQVTQITNSDGETTKFDRKGGSTEVTVTDGQGNVVKDKAKVVVGPKEDGSYVVELEKGRQLDANGEGTHVLRKADGTEVLLKGKDGPEIESDADKLVGKMNLNPEEKRQFKQDLADIDKLPPDQRKKVYESLSKIQQAETYNLVETEHPPSARFTKGDQAELVTSLAHQIAHPESIQQGAHESCAAANMEALMAKNHPDRYADMVSKLATEGKYELPSGKVVYAETTDGKLDPKSDAFGRRSATSELFQDAAIDLGLEPHSYKSLHLDSPDIEPRPPGVTPSTDCGERVVANPAPDGERVTVGGRTIIKEPLGDDKYRNWVLQSDGSAVRSFSGLTSDQQMKAYKELMPEEKYGEMPIKEPADLEKALAQNGGPPMKVGIHLRDDLAKTGMVGEDAGAASGHHAVVITKIENGKVYYENTAGGLDHSYPNGTGVPIDDFVKSMQLRDKDKSDVQKGALVKGYEGKAGDSATEGSKGDKGAEGDSGIYKAPTDASSDAAALKSLRDDPEVKAQRQSLEKAAEKIPDPEQRKEFLDNMKKFDARTPALESEYQKQFEAEGMKSDEAAEKAREKAHKQVEDTYRNLNTLMNAEDSSNENLPKEADRIVLAQQCMEHCADTKSISQVPCGTCFAASAETRTYAKDPAEATRLVAEVATTGVYETHPKPPEQPMRIDLTKDNSSLKQQELPGIKGASNRDYASQVFQVTAANVALERQNGLTTPRGDLHYEQHPPEPGSVEVGEQLVDRSKDPPVVVADGYSLNAPQADYMLRQISPEGAAGTSVITNETDYENIATKFNNRAAILANAKINGGEPIDTTDPDCFNKVHKEIDQREDLSPEDKKELHKRTNEMAIANDSLNNPNVSYVRSEEDLKENLARLKREGNLPVVIGVETFNEPFFTDSGGRDAGGSGGGHFVTITEFDETTGVAKMQNQWGKEEFNRDMSVHDLYMATGSDDYHKLDVAQDRTTYYEEDGRTNYQAEFQVLEQEHEGKLIDDDQYDREITRLFVERAHSYNKDEADTPEEQRSFARAGRQIRRMILEIEAKDPERAAKIKKDIAEQTKGL